ncbi:uncharacterized protein LOC106465090 isoform X2 [Limulus polyphemus]|uniref:Uncharacterized protein LOC106465090 isoform X2 n=1 Tax=Limulus polyphemus TaxID=6850 RepID=A0ABM1SYB6_LIMPO|nr:uncharacterized protein LOC106465090 isoform X2 [Limulus polyphemus]
MAGLVSRLIIFSVSPFTSSAHQEHFKNDNLQESCSDCQNILEGMKQIHEELKKYLEEDETARAHFIESFAAWISTRDKSIKYLNKIDIHFKNTSLGDKISKIGSSAGKIGGTMAVVGITLAPVTGGFSLGLSAGGAALAAAGKLTAEGANVAGSIIYKNKCQKIISTLDKDTKQSDELFKNMETLKRCDENREELLKEVKEFIDIIENGVNASKSVVGLLEKAVEFSQNLAHLEEVTFESADKVLKQTFTISSVNGTFEEKTICDQVDLKPPSNPISQSSGEGSVVSPVKKKRISIKLKSKDSKK